MYTFIEKTVILNKIVAQGGAVMKRILSVFMVIALLMCFVATAVAAPLPVDINAASVLLIDMETGEVLYSENETKRVIPAGTTKLMTALVAYELCENPAEPFVIEADALSDITAWNDRVLSPMIQPGETVTMNDVIGGVLVGSGNDAAAVAAYHSAGSIEAFVEHMNNKAAKLGMTGTHFTNPHGRSGDDHYTTAADMGKLMTVIYNTPALLSVLNLESFTFAEGTSSERVLQSGNMFYSGNDVQKYSAGKASFGGYTGDAGGCLVAGAEKNGVKLLCMVFGAVTSDDSWVIAKKLFEYGFGITVKYSAEELLAAVALPEVEKMILTPDFTGITVEVSKYLDISKITATVEAPADEESNIGEAQYYDENGILITVVPVVFEKAKPPVIIRILKVILIVACILFVLLVVGFITLKMLQIRHEKERARKKAMREQRRAEMFEEIDYSEFTNEE